MEQAATNCVCRRMTKIKNNRRAVKRVGFLLFALTLLFPPWSDLIQAWSTQCFAGYSFLLAPPKLKSAEEFRQIFFVYDSPGGDQVTVHIEYIRLALEWIVLLFLTLGLDELFRDESGPRRAVGVLALLMGLAALTTLFSMPACHGT